jgi:ADP-heptose:LPS heptosyltransferase
VEIDRAYFRYRSNYVGAIASELAAPALRAWARVVAPGAPTEPRDWRRLVILGSTHIGDVLYRTASLPYLKRALPNCQITYVTSPLTAELLTTNPSVDDVLPIAESGADWRRRAARELRARAFDAALCTDNIAYQHDLILATRAGIPARVGFVHKGFSALVTRPVPGPPRLPAPAYMRAIVAHVGDLAPTWDLTPVLVTTAEDERRAEAVWRELGLGQAALTIACAITLRQTVTATWPPDQFLAALAEVNRRADIEVVLCGSAADAPLLDATARQAPFRCRVAAGLLTLRALGAFVRRCHLLLGMDSGPRHIANAVGTPVVFVRSLKATRIEAGVYCANETDVAPADEWLPFEAQRAALARLDPRAVADVVLMRAA